MNHTAFSLNLGKRCIILVSKSTASRKDITAFAIPFYMQASTTVVFLPRWDDVDFFYIGEFNWKMFTIKCKMQ